MAIAVPRGFEPVRDCVLAEHRLGRHGTALVGGERWKPAQLPAFGHDPTPPFDASLPPACLQEHKPRPTSAPGFSQRMKCWDATR